MNVKPIGCVQATSWVELEMAWRRETNHREERRLRFCGIETSDCVISE